MLKNLEELKKVLPEPKTLDHIQLSVRNHWIDDEVKELFIKSLGMKAKIERLEASQKYQVNFEDTYSRRNDETSINDVPFREWFPKFINAQDYIIKDKDGEKNYSATLRFTEKMKVADEMFMDFLRVNPEISEPLIKEYNNTFNNWVDKDYKKAATEMEVPDKHPEMNFRANQLEMVAMAESLGKTICGQSVGAGKTLIMALLAYRLKLIGRANKPMIVVPLKVVKKTVREITKGDQKLPPAFPKAKVLDTTQYSFEECLPQIAYNDWDMIVIPDTWFKRIAISPERERDYVKKELEFLHLQETERAELRGSSRSNKDFVKRKEALEGRLANLRNFERKPNIVFEELGVDAIMLDEAQSVKNLSTGTQASKYGVSSTVSQVAVDFNIKSDYIREITGGKNVFLFTATPVSNSVVEIYSIIKNIAPEEWEKRSIYGTDNFLDMFADMSNTIGVKPDGEVGEVRKISSFKNLNALQSLFKKYVDYRPFIDFTKVPDINEIRFSVEMTEEQSEYYKGLLKRLEEMGSKDAEEDNVLNVITDGRNSSVSQSLITREAPTLDNSPKIKKMLEVAIKTYRKFDRTNQVIFLDNYGGTTLGISNLHRFIKKQLIKEGVPESEIVIVNGKENNDTSKKLDIQDDFNKGLRRFIIGTSASIGAGMNLQERTIMTHNLDIPWTPTSIEQRLGRMKRPGNMFNNCLNCNYFTRGSFDAFSASTVAYKASWQEELLLKDQDTCENKNGNNWNINMVMGEILEDPVEKEKVLFRNEIMESKEAISSLRSEITRYKRQIGAAEKELREREEKIVEYQENIKNDYYLKRSEIALSNAMNAVEKLTEDIGKYQKSLEITENNFAKAEKHFQELENSYKDRLEFASTKPIQKPEEINIDEVLSQLWEENKEVLEVAVHEELQDIPTSIFDLAKKKGVGTIQFKTVKKDKKRKVAEGQLAFC